MQIVIEIPESIYETIKEEEVGNVVYKAIANGTPLPKGHGRILDEKDILDTKNNDGGWYDLVDMPEYIAGVKAIIEADKTKCDTCYHNETEFSICQYCTGGDKYSERYS